jgi:hypothetical protein
LSAPITSAALLSVADTLAQIEDVSTTVHLRRAVSSAYYALFHGLIADATRRTVGDHSDREDDRYAIGRWYNHSEMRLVSRWVICRARGESIPDGVADLLDHPPPELVDLARAFVQLQESRNDADYDHRAELDRADAIEAINTARDALARLGQLTGARAYDNFLLLLLDGPKLASRRR